jgi:hypothetical protein
MHLYIADPYCHGLGTKFVRVSAREYFRVLQLTRLFCPPNAFNLAPNRTRERAGFRYHFPPMVAPGPVNFRQPVTRWGRGARSNRHGSNAWKLTRYKKVTVTWFTVPLPDRLIC